MLATMYNTGARVSEIIRLNVEDLELGPTATVRIHGKGRKERVVPLWKDTRRQLADWLRQISTAGGEPLFPSRRSERLTRPGFRSRLNAAVAIARQSCSSLRKRRVFPHLIRHYLDSRTMSSRIASLLERSENAVLGRFGRCALLDIVSGPTDLSGTP